jgi:hypothetical protein
MPVVCFRSPEHSILILFARTVMLVMPPPFSYALEISHRRAFAAPGGAIRGPYACLPQLGATADGLLLPEHPILVLLLRANDLCFGARSANFLFSIREPVNRG